MRQRRPVLQEVFRPGPDAGEDEEQYRKRMKRQEQEMAPYLIGIVLFIAVAVAAVLMWWHPHIDFHRAPASKRDLEKAEVLANLKNHTILHVGGLHYSGLTLLSELLIQHPDLAGMRHQEGADKRKTHWVSDVANDGCYLQTVIPNFGTDHRQFMLWKSLSKFAKRILPESAVERFPWMKMRQGIGRFALHPGHHLDDSSSLISSRAQVHLFSEWALFWDLSKKVLLEKSPSNVVLSPFLHRLWSLDLETPSPGRFIFQQRHPLAVAIATKIKLGAQIGDDLSLADLMENWVMAEERRAKDIESYFEYYGFGKDVYRILQFEDLLREPDKVLGEIFQWLGLAPAAVPKGKVMSDVNLKHFKHYCASEASEEAERSSRNSLSVPSSSVRSGAVKPALSRRGALAEAPTVPEAALRTDTALSTPMPSRPTSGSIAGRRELAMVAGTGTANAAVRRVSQRPQSQMRLRVQANRPFSAPRMRYERAEVPSQRQGDAMPVPRTTAIPKPARRPSSANVGKTPRADGRRGIAMPPSRPRSAFAPCRGQRRPCTVPDCEPQARWMTEG